MKKTIMALTFLASTLAFAGGKEVCLNFSNLDKRPAKIELQNGLLSDEYFGPMTISLNDISKTEHQTSAYDENSDGKPDSRVTTTYAKKLQYLDKDGLTGLIYLSFSRDGLIGAKNLDVQIGKAARASSSGNRVLVSSPAVELEVNLGRCH